MSLAEVKACIATMIASASELTNVIWADQNANQLPLPYCKLTLGAFSNPCQDGVISLTDLTRPAGQEIEQRVIGYREATLDLEFFSDATVDIAGGSLTAQQYAENTKSALALPAYHDQLETVGVSPFDLSAPTQYLPVVVSVGFRGRATWSLRIFLPAACARAFTGYIAEANVTTTS